MALERVLVMRLGAMGDIVHTLPAVASLRDALPNAQIGWVVEERWRELLCARSHPLHGPLTPQRPLADTVHPVNTLAWRTALMSDETWREGLAAYHELRAARYQVAIDFQGALKSSFLARASRAETIIGFREPREAIARLFYTRSITAQGTHIVDQNISLAEALGARGRIRFDLPHDPDADAWCDRELARRELREFAIINPGAGWGAKCWPAENYAAVASALGAAGLPSLINYGPGEDQLAKQVSEETAGAASPVACSIGELVALARRARLFIGGDTGPLHVAVAVGVPVVAIYGPTNPARNGPYGSRALVLRSGQSETSHVRRQEPEAGLLTITPAEVIAAAERLLNEEAR